MPDKVHDDTLPYVPFYVRLPPLLLDSDINSLRTCIARTVCRILSQAKSSKWGQGYVGALGQRPSQESQKRDLKLSPVLLQEDRRFSKVIS